MAGFLADGNAFVFILDDKMKSKDDMTWKHLAHTVHSRVGLPFRLAEGVRSPFVATSPSRAPPSCFDTTS